MRRSDLVHTGTLAAFSLAVCVLTGCPPGGVPSVPITLETTNFTEDTTLKAGVYIAEQDLYVSDGVTLTLEPGVTIKFKEGVDMTARGRLSAVGTAGSPIVLTGFESIRGYWGGLRFYQSNSVTNRLEYVTIEYGGGYWDANLYVTGSASVPSLVAVANCTLRESETYGFIFDQYGEVSQFSDCVVTANASGAGKVYADRAGDLDDTTTYVQNDEDIVVVLGSTLSEDATWPGIDAVYQCDGSIGIDADLTIAPGAQFAFAAGKDMSVHEDGSLHAVGAEDAPIVFTGIEATRGYWGGVRFYQSNATANRLEYVTIEYGGGYWHANLLVTGSSSVPSLVAVVNCTFQGSGEYGFQLDQYCTVTEFAGNVVTANTLGAGYVYADTAGYLDDSSTYVGNDADVVVVQGSTLSQEATWHAIDAAYLCDGSISVQAPLTLAAGAQLVFAAGKEMSVTSDGSLTAVGAVDAGIVFTGEEAIPGYWGGLRFYQSNAVANRLENVTIEYGGGYWNANLVLTGTASTPVQIAVTGCHIAHSQTWGILLNEYVTLNADIDTANTFEGNADGDVSAPG